MLKQCRGWSESKTILPRLFFTGGNRGSAKQSGADQPQAETETVEKFSVLSVCSCSNEFLFTPPSPLDTRPFLLLPRHVHAQRRFIVLDQLAAHIHGRTVEHASELERRLVFVPHWRTTVCAGRRGAGSRSAPRSGSTRIQIVR